MTEGYLAKYLRVSDDDKDIGEKKNESDSIGNQRKLLEHYIKRHQDLAKYPVREFLDDGYSGLSFNRPGIQFLLREVMESRVACIIVKDFSRFGRNYIETGDYIEQIFPFLGVRFISISDNYDSIQKTAGLEVGFKNLMHDLYSRDLSKKMKTVKHLHQEQGRYSGGDVPYGYKRNEGYDGTYYPDPKAAQIVRKIFQLAAEGTYPARIADILNSERVLTPGEYKNQTANQNYVLKTQKRILWTPLQVRGIIQNEVYIGTFICHKSTNIRPREIKRNDKAEYMKFENDHEALVGEQLFQLAQNVIRTQNKPKPYKKEENPHALKGKVKCGCCGYGMIQSKKKDVYRCHMGNSCGSHMKIQTKILEEVILSALSKISEARQGKKQKQASKTPDVVEHFECREKKRLLEMKLGYCKTNRINLYQQWKEEKITKAEYMEGRDIYLNQETECLNKLNSLNQKIKNEALGQTNFATWEYLDSFMENRKLTKKLADDFIDRVEIYGSDRIEIQWKFKDITELVFFSPTLT